MKILVINSGSSSLKFQVIDSESEQVLAKGVCERIGIDGRFTYKTKEGISIKEEILMENHTQAVHTLLDMLVDSEKGVITDFSQINVIGHRLVHGGEKFSGSVIITDQVIQAMTECNDLAPLHNPANLIGVEACQKLMPDTLMVGVFDTAFNQTMEPKAFLYGLPYQYYEKYKIRRYGFHGISHKYVSQRAAEFMKQDPRHVKTIVCHLGNGSSICAVKNGKSVDTSMGLSPLEGLIMGTRSGDIDPSAIEFLAKKENLSLEEMLNVLNKESGVYGISGLSSDFRDLDQAVSEGNARAKTAREMFCYRAAKYIGSYAAAMNGVDVICFTAGVGENDGKVREMICSYLGYLGLALDSEANKKRGEETVLSTPDSKVTVLLAPTNEELAICRETVALLK